jgi:hypothetical protein
VATNWDKRLFQLDLINLEKALDHFLLQPVLSGNKCVDVSETISQIFFFGFSSFGIQVDYYSQFFTN